MLGAYHSPVTRVPAPRLLPPHLLPLLLAALLPMACSAPTAPTPGVPSDQPPAGSSSSPAPSETPPPPPPQSDTAWGRIWDGVPYWFPVPIDADEADPQQGPVSGAWAVPSAKLSAPALAGYYRKAFDDLGWTASVDGPLEDGSFTVSSSTASGCNTLTTILPRGDESLITVLFGAGCPFR